MTKNLVAILGGASESGCKLLGQRRPLHNLLIVVLCLAGMASFCARANGQVRFGSVVGVVADTSEGAIAGATVTLTNTGTNEKRTLETDGSGNYSFANVSAGQYNVDIEKSGFKHFRKENLEVNVDVVARVNVALEVGSVTQSVVVTSEAIMMQT